MRFDTINDAVFPVEVMDQIFRSSCLRRGDLARCCLLARRFLSAARKWLYYEVEVILAYENLVWAMDYDRPGTSGDGTSEDERSDSEPDYSDTEYSCRTAALIETIRNDPALARLIRRVEFCRKMGPRSGTRVTEEEATVEILELAPMATAVDFSLTFETDEWLENAIPQLERGTYARYTDISVYNFAEAVSAFVSKFENLRSLTITKITRFEPHGGIGACQLSTTCLETISIQDVWSPSTISIANFVALSASTLRNLGIHLSDFPKVDLKAFPNLGRIELFLDRFTSRPFDSTEFRKLRHCSNLTTIALRGDGVREDCENFIFGPLNEGPNGFLDFRREGLPQVRRVDFAYHGCHLRSVSIDHLLGFFDELHWVPKTFFPLKELGISSFYLEDLKLQFVRMMCEEAGVELILLESE